MYPIFLNIGPLTIHTYGVFFALGILAAVALSEYVHQRDGGRPGAVADVAFLVLVGGLLGARLLFVLVNRGYFLRNPAEIVKIWNGGLVFYGGLVGGALAFIIVARRKRIDLWRLADTVAPGLALGHAFGRLGCFAAGSCYGKPTGLPWAVTYTDPRSLAADVLGVPVHPTQLYSFGFLTLLSAILAVKARRPAFKGQIIAFYTIFYGTYRFAVEFLRGDPRGDAALLGVTLSTSQWISAALVPLAVAAYIYLHRKGGSKRGPGEILLQDGPGPALQRGR